MEGGGPLRGGSPSSHFSRHERNNAMNNGSGICRSGGPAVEEIGERLAGKYLTFKLDQEEFAIEILKVNQIIRLQEIFSVPRTPPFVRGMINLRGTIIPIIDLRIKLAMAGRIDTERSCIVVIQLDQMREMVNVGVVIDEVREVIEISAADIEETPEFGAGIDTAFITGIAKTGRSVKILLDIGKVLAASEIATITGLSGSETIGGSNAPHTDD